MIYLDSAATSFQKPKAVCGAVQRAMESMSSPGRGCYRPAMLAADCVLDCREALAAYFNVKKPENIIFTLNATHALNIAIASLAKSGDRVVISGYEHNSVVRPLYALGAKLDIVSTPLFRSSAMLRSFSEKLTGAALCVCTHVSNAFGYILPLEDISRLCRERGVPLIVDASQSAGVIPVDCEKLSAAFVAMPGHKGLMGPQGTGVLICNSETRPILFGGTGSNSAERLMPDYLPERLEAGTHNVPGIAGLLQGVRYLASQPQGQILEHERALRELLASRLSGVRELKLFSDDSGAQQSGVLSIVPERMDVDELAERLGKSGICARAGLHCAPVAHETVGTDGTGTLRLSVSPFNTKAEMVRTAEQIKKIINNIAK